MSDYLERGEKIGRMLAVMFASFPASSSDPDAAAQGYLIALEGQDESVVEAAIKAFIQGAVPGHNPRFVPSSAELVAQCRVTPMPESLLRRLSSSRPALPKPSFERVKPTPEQRAAIVKMATEFSAKHAAMRAEERSAENSGPDQFERANFRFDARRAQAEATANVGGEE
jgi:hypothetical protein